MTPDKSTTPPGDVVLTAPTWITVAHLILQCTPLGALLANQHWALIHEGLHENLPRWQTNLLCALFGTPAGPIRAYHARHHRDNRVRERIDALPAWLYYPQLLGGLYVLELLLCLTVWYGPLILALQGLLVWVWGWWYVAALCVRAVLISLMDYVYHYRGDTDVRQGHDLDAGRWGRLYLLGANLHGAHHRNPSTPGLALRVDGYTDRLLPAIFNQLKGPHHV